VLAAVAVRDGHIVDYDPAEATRAVIDADGALVTPALVEPHIHLDTALTLGQPRHNRTGSLFEGIAIWGERARSLSAGDVTQRARSVLRWQVANGVLHVRAHVDVCDPELTALRALLELRSEIADQISLQLVAFPQQGILSFPDGARLLERAVDLGVDAVGAIPHFEMSREYGERSIKLALELAAAHRKLVDVHCDETDDEHSRFLEVLAAETVRLGLEGRVTASHTTAMHSYNGAYAHKLIANLKRAGVHIVTNPLANAVLQGRFDAYPIRRGHTRVKELLAAGVNVCIGHDSVMDPWYPFGYGDPLQGAMMLAHLAHMSGWDDTPTLFEMIGPNAARALGLSAYGLEPGARADLVVFDAPSPHAALRLGGRRRAVIRGGRLISRTEPARTTIVWDGREEEIDFLEPRR
jgi:cytosine/creatinine deaminase